jgi:hypothetical protein
MLCLFFESGAQQLSPMLIITWPEVDIGAYKAHVAAAQVNGNARHNEQPKAAPLYPLKKEC